MTGRCWNEPTGQRDCGKSSQTSSGRRTDIARDWERKNGRRQRFRRQNLLRRQRRKPLPAIPANPRWHSGRSNPASMLPSGQPIGSCPVCSRLTPRHGMTCLYSEKRFREQKGHWRKPSRMPGMPMRIIRSWMPGSGMFVPAIIPASMGRLRRSWKKMHPARCAAA